MFLRKIGTNPEKTLAHKIRLIAGLSVLVLIFGSLLATYSAAQFAFAEEPTGFTVRITNVSRSTTLVTSTGDELYVPLSPGVWAVQKRSGVIFTSGRSYGGTSIEALAEDGDPSRLADFLENQPTASSSGLFNTPIGFDAPGPIGPGQAYLFTISAVPGETLTLATMFVESNDLFYAPDSDGIPLFDENGDPIFGDMTSYILLWDAGTELNEEPGVGPNQAPRQAGPDTGDEEDGVIHLVDDDYEYPDVSDVIRVLISRNPLN